MATLSLFRSLLVTTPLGVYAYIFEDDHPDGMDALTAMPQPQRLGENVVRLRG